MQKHKHTTQRWDEWKEKENDRMQWFISIDFKITHSPIIPRKAFAGFRLFCTQFSPAGIIQATWSEHTSQEPTVKTDEKSNYLNYIQLKQIISMLICLYSTEYG